MWDSAAIWISYFPRLTYKICKMVKKKKNENILYVCIGDKGIWMEHLLILT